MNFEIRLLSCALALAEYRSFAKAAESLHVSQPALSRSIQNLEHIAGVRIFERGTRHVDITGPGAVFLEYAREVMARCSDLTREMELLKGLDKGELQVGVGMYGAVEFVDLAIGRIAQHHPKVRLSVANDTWVNFFPRLRRRELDLVIVDVRTMAVNPELHVTPLAPRRSFPAVRPGHPLLKHKGTLRMGDLLHYPFVSIARLPPAVLRQLVSESTEGENPARPGLKSFPSIACDSVAMIKKIVQTSDAVTILPLNAFLADIEAKTLVALPSFQPLLQTEYVIVRLARRSLSPLGGLFVNTVLEVDAEVNALVEKATTQLRGSVRPVGPTEKRKAKATRPR
jgi:DNA-binding transcriptional LysR family regulator